MEGSKHERKKYNNGRRHSAKMRQVARRLRSSGSTHREIVRELGVALGTAHLWTIDIELSEKQKIAVEKRRKRRAYRWTPEERKKISRRLAPFQFKKRHTKASLIAEIKSFHKKNGRIPMKREFGSRAVFRKYFGSWNNAIRAAGFEPNPEFFAKCVRANDGHMCDSMIEQVVDDWLHENKITHERNWRYPGSKMSADFYLPENDLVIEVFGLRGGSRVYDRNYERKMKLISANNIQLLSLQTEDVLKEAFVKKIPKALKRQSSNVR